MGIDLIMDIALFYMIWKFGWKKSRIRHMSRKGCSSNRDNIAFAVFVAAFIWFLIVPYTFMDFGIFVPFVVIGGIFTAYIVTTRVCLGASPRDISYKPEHSLEQGLKNLLCGGK